MESNHVRDLMEAYSSIYTENEEVEQLDEFAPGLQGPVDNFLKGGQKVLKGLGLKVNEKERPTPDQNAQKAKINQNQNQSFDLFDIIKGHLLDEGFADTEEAALAIMTNMSEEWKQSIVEGFPNVQSKPRPGDAGTSGLKMIQTPGGQHGYINKHSGGEILPSGTVNKIMGGNLMVKNGTKKNTNSNIA